MNYLVISDELIVNSLSSELKKVYDRYIDSLTLRTEFDELRSKFLSRQMSQVWYNSKCVELTKKVKHMTFDLRRGHFIIRPTIDKKRTYLGASNNFDEACGFMSEYLKAKIEQSVN
jgi:hypothetical protein